MGDNDKVEHLDVNWRDYLPKDALPAFEHASASQGTAPQEDSLYGRVVTLTATPGGVLPKSTARVNAIWVPKTRRAKIWTVTISVDKVPLRTLDQAKNGQLVAYIQYMVGAIPFTKKVFATSTVPRRIPIQGTSIQIDVAWEQYAPNFLGVARQDVNFSVACEEGVLQSVDYYSSQWIRNPTAPSPLLVTYDIFHGVGMLMSAFGYLATGFGAGETQYFPFFFDQAGGAPGTAGPPFMIGTPLTALNQTFAYSDEFSPQQPFNQGLLVSLSTTDVVYTAPVGGASWRCDTKLGT